MNQYEQMGSVAVAANTADVDNLAGFGARRFMQDMYQQQDDHAQAIDHQTRYASRPSAHHGYQPRDSEHNHTGYGNYQDQSLNDPYPYQTASSYARDFNNGSHHDQHYQSHHHYHQQEQRTARSEAPAATASSATRKGSGSKTVWRSDSLESSATDSTVGLVYARSGDSQYTQSEHLKRAGPANSGRSVPIPQIRTADRATIYDDDYEEPIHAATIDQMPRPTSPASATLGDLSTDASFTIVRATVLEPDLPKAKCADCGEKLDFEELANHSCQPSGASKPPLLTIQVPPSSSSSTLSSASTSPALMTPRSPFFDRYDNLVNDGGPMSPALFGTVTPMENARAREDNDETPKAHAVRIIGTQAAIKLSNIKVSTQADAADVYRPRASPPSQPPPMQRSASDTAADAAAAARRKVIEQQRTAKKKKDMMASPMPRAATTSSLSKQGISNDDHATHALSASEGQHAKTGSSSSLSSTGTDSSERMALSSRLLLDSRAGVGSSCTANMTPSSSYERFEDGVAKQNEASIKASIDSTSCNQTRERGRVDLSGIEEMMKGLTASPEPLQRTLTDVPRKSGHGHEATRASSQRPRSATDLNKTERERALELELERLRDKERTRRLQALRLKEKEGAAKRCCICDCSLTSSRTPFVERDGKFLCARDWKELYLPKCRKCNLSVEKGAVKSSDGALRGVFHRSCFSCAACEALFTDGSFYVFNNQPYCSRHYHRLNGSLCRECESGIEGDCRQTDTGDRFHPHCFSCQYSSKSGACLEALADYYVVGGQRLCERHANKVGRRLAKAGQKQLDLRAQKRMTMLRSLR